MTELMENLFIKARKYIFSRSSGVHRWIEKMLDRTIQI